MSSTFTRKNPEDQFPNSSAIRAQAYELVTPIGVTFDVEAGPEGKRLWEEPILLARGAAEVS